MEGLWVKATDVVLRRQVILSRFIIGLDFDGTLCKSEFPDIGAIRTDVVDLLKRFKIDYDVEYVLVSCRHDEHERLAAEWCRDVGLEIARVNVNSDTGIALMGDCRKIYADFYLDDHNYYGWCVESDFHLERWLVEQLLLLEQYILKPHSLEEEYV